MDSIPSFNQIYQKIVSEILASPLKYDTPKFGGTTSEMLIHPNYGFVNFVLDNSSSFPLLTLRDIKLKTFIAEIIWYLSGQSDPLWLQKYTKIWNAFADEDGKISCSYGYRWRFHFGRDQIQGAINLLKKDSTNRQAVIITWDPSKDGLDSPKKKNVPCIPFFQLTVFENKLFMNLVWRSNDMYLGIPHDVAGFSLLQAILAQELNLEIGYLHYTIEHAHLYANQIESAQKLIHINPDTNFVKLVLPPNSYQIARDGSEKEKDELFQKILDNLDEQYHPILKLKPVGIVV